MALQTVRGSLRDRVRAMGLSKALEAYVEEGVLYLGYPVLSSADDQVEVHALLVSREHGLVAFLFADEDQESAETWDALIAEQDQLYAAVEVNLKRHDSLRLGRQLRFPIQTATIFSSRIQSAPSETDAVFVDLSSVGPWVKSLPSVDEATFRALQAALQRVTTIKPPKKREFAVSSGSRGARLKIFEREIANLDRWQIMAAIETPEGPQRIRGLAGSGKTIVLALKAAYLHALHPDWNILVTFHSRSLYQQFTDLVTRFSFEHSNDAPDFDKLLILHSWGSGRRVGVYSMLADILGQMPRDFGAAQAIYGREGAFQGVCSELLQVLESRGTQHNLFDAVLIDEAQDLPPEFFQLIHSFAREPKRITWAYDELQRLDEKAMPSVQEMFGKDAEGNPWVNITNSEGDARRDIVLPVCYRNTPWALATAHSLGLGIYRERGLIQHFDEPSVWSEIGYDVERGDLNWGEQVSLNRNTESAPSYFYDYLDAEDAVVSKRFADVREQDHWLSEQVRINLTVDELEPDDILIVLPDPMRAKARGTEVRAALARVGVPSHIVGIGTSADEIFRRGSVAITHIHRAKGNEAPMVYVLDAQYASDEHNEVTRRNTLFTAITRSRAWVRIVGWGPHFPAIHNELQAVRREHFRLRFKVPTVEELRSLRRLHRERSENEAKSLVKFTQGVAAILETMDQTDIDFSDLPIALKTRLFRQIQEQLKNVVDD